MRLLIGGVVVLYASWPPPVCAGRTPAAWEIEDQAIRRVGRDLDVAWPTTISPSRSLAAWEIEDQAILFVVARMGRARFVDSGAGIGPPTFVDEPSYTPSTSRMRPTVFRYPFLAADVIDLLATNPVMGTALRFMPLFISSPAARATPRHDCPRAPARAPASTALARMGPPKRYRSSRSPRPSCGGRGGGRYRVRLPPHMM